MLVSEGKPHLFDSTTLMTERDKDRMKLQTLKNQKNLSEIESNRLISDPLMKIYTSLPKTFLDPYKKKYGLHKVELGPSVTYKFYDEQQMIKEI